MSDDLEVRLLGPVDAYLAGERIAVGGAKQRAVLAALALAPSRVVAADQLVGAVWGEHVPDRALGTLQVYVSNLRRLLGPGRASPVVRWQAPGYLLDIADQRTDLGRFRAQVTQGQAAQEGGDLRRAAEQLRAALELWHGPALAGLSPNGTVQRQAVRLEAERTAALGLRIDVDLALGRTEEVAGELAALVADDPLNEALAARLMVALYRSGRQADALATFRDIRTRLDEELGVSPGAELTRLERAVLEHAPSLRGVGAPRRSDAVTTTLWPPGPTPTAWLVTQQGERHPVTTPEVLIGRGEENGITLEHTSVSRLHARLLRRADGHELVDLGSTNGTRVNDLDLKDGIAYVLADGDEITIGAVSLVFRPAGDKTGRKPRTALPRDA